MLNTPKSKRTTYTQLIDDITKEVRLQIKSISKKNIDFILKAEAEIFKKHIIDKERINTMFGTFKIKTRAQRKIPHPKTKKIITIHEQRVISFRPAKALNDAAKKKKNV